jgi:hypothetical protein
MGGKLKIWLRRAFPPLLLEHKIVCIRLKEKCQEKKADKNKYFARINHELTQMNTNKRGKTSINAIRENSWQKYEICTMQYEIIACIL